MKLRFLQRLTAAVLIVGVLMMMPLTVVARTIAEIEAEQAQLEAEKEQLEADLERLRADEAEKEAYLETLQEQIEVVQEQIDVARQSINELNDSINELTLKLEKSEEEIADTMDQFKRRLVAIYREGSVSTLEILLDSTSFSEFSMRSEMITAMSRHDEELLLKIEQYMEETEDERVECEKQKEEVAELQKTLEAKQKELDALYEENEAALAELRNAEEETLAAIAHNEEEGAAKIAEIEELIAAQKAYEESLKQQQTANGGTYYPTGGGGVEGFNPIWPMPGVSYISCYYGGYAGHRGMDIAGPYGTPIVASESGTVIEANNYDSWGQSWGYYVLIYHNGTFTTRYAHLSAVAVSNGQFVQKGQIIGYEGATGNVTGPHLHFEVYQNGTRVDPMLFL